jgi:hypothetical protein
MDRSPRSIRDSMVIDGEQAPSKRLNGFRSSRNLAFYRTKSVQI